MIDQSHGLSLGQPGPVAAGNEGDAEAMETRVDARFSDDGIDASVFIGGKFAGHLTTDSLKLFERWLEGWVNRNGKILSWIILFTLGIAQPQSSGCQVDIFNGDRALRESAAGVESDFKAGPHPFWLVCQSFPDFGNVVVGQFWFQFLRRPRNPESGNGVGLGELAPDSFVDELGEELDLKQRRVVTDFPTVDLGRHAPADIRPAMRVFDLARVNDALLVQEGFDGLPSDSVTPSRIAFALPMGCDVVGHPGVESRGIDGAADALFFDGSFVSQSLSFSGVGWIIGAQAGGFVAPFAGIRIAFTDIPERGASMTPDMGHPRIVCQSLLPDKWNKVECPYPIKVSHWAEVGWQRLPLHYEAIQWTNPQQVTEQSPFESPKKEGL